MHIRLAKSVTALTFFIIITLQVALGQEKAKLVGKVTDKDTGEELIGASVTVVGLNIGGLTNVDGEYMLMLPPGRYDIRVSYVGYQTLVVKNVEVREGQTNRQDVQLKVEASVTEEIVVEASVSAATEGALLVQRRKSSSISDAISAEQIRRTPDSDAAETVKRITGVSVVSGKYVYVRGLGERYSSTQLNGGNIPSPEPEKKVVPFDIIPASLIESITTIKTFLPDQPGNFAGGLVKIKTKEFPDEFQLTFSASGSFNNRAHFRSDVLTYPGSPTDWLGFDNGLRRLPSGLPTTLESRAIPTRGPQRAAIARLFNNGVFDPRIGTFGPNQGYSLAFADQVNIGIPVGYIASITYSSDAVFKDNLEIFFPNAAAPTDPTVSRYQYRGQMSLYTVNLGGIMHFNFRLDDNNKIGLKGTYNRSLEDETRTARGIDIFYEPSQESVSSRLRLLERELLSTQITGNHYLGWLAKAELDWMFQYATAGRNEPDNRETLLSGTSDEDLTIQQFRNQRFYANLFDRQFDGFFNLSIPFTQWDNLKSKLKLGGLFLQKNRRFEARRFSYRPLNFAAIRGVRPDELFTPERIERGDIEFIDDTFPSDAYTAVERTLAGYVMLELPLFTQFRFVGGVRVENNFLNADAFFGPPASPIPISGGFNQTNFLPSLNLIYSIGEEMNFRAGFSYTVAQPEMRELAPFRFDDYVSSTYGNPFLEQTRITNLDFRWEWFPRFGELIAVSVFYKDLIKPLERIVLDEIGTVPIFSTINGKEARNFGAEFEIRKSLDFIAEPLRDFSINLNLTLVRSNIVPPDELVLYNETIGKQVTAAPPSLRFERPLQGQSDYVLNVALGYQNIENGINVLLLYNIVGRRIIQLSGSQFILDNFYEEPRNQVDLAVSKSFGRNFTIKLIAKNLLDDRFLTTILGRTAERFNTGRVLGLSFTYNL